jgi:hypothetical protein
MSAILFTIISNNSLKIGYISLTTVFGALFFRGGIFCIIWFSTTCIISLIFYVAIVISLVSKLKNNFCNYKVIKKKKPSRYAATVYMWEQLVYTSDCIQWSNVSLCVYLTVLFIVMAAIFVVLSGPFKTFKTEYCFGSNWIRFLIFYF